MVVAHILMTLQARAPFYNLTVMIGTLHQTSVALKTSAHGDGEVMLADADGVPEAGGKLPAVIKTIFEFYKPLGVKTFRSMTGVASGMRSVRIFDPTLILVAHDVAVHTGRGVIT
jgi:hypothetical protein